MDPADPNDEATSDLGESIDTSDFTSATSSLLRYSFDHGRRYQGFIQDRYGLPNDDIEQMREGIKHKLYMDYIYEPGILFLSPIGNNPHKIVDLGTGVGFWAQDVAEAFPSARVIGTDISPIQPHWAPPNVEFHVEDLEDEQRPWTNIYHDADLIHIRAFLQTVRNPRKIIQRSFENIRPGGWIECHEVLPELFSDDGSVMKHHPVNTIYGLVNGRFSDIYGWNLEVSRSIPQLLEEAGFINVQVKHTHVPMGRWHHDVTMREMGMFCQIICADWAVALFSRPDIMGVSEDEAGRILQALSDVLDDLSIHGYLVWVDVWAQKPGGFDS